MARPTHSILQAGLPKSGNSWLWTLIQAGLRAAEVPLRSYVAEHPIRALAPSWNLSFPGLADIDMFTAEPDCDWMQVLPRYKEKINDIHDYAARVTHCWTHARVWNQRCATSVTAFAKRIYLVRDLRSVIVSRAHYDMTPYKRLEFANPPSSFEHSLARALANEPPRWVEHVNTWRALAEHHEVLFVRYEDLRSSFADSCARIFAYLELAAPSELIQTIMRETSLTAMREQAPTHVRSGELAEWRSLLDPADLASLPAGVTEVLQHFGYPTA